MPESLSQQRIADQYTSVLHVSGASIASWDSRDKLLEKDLGLAQVAKVYDGAGNTTGISLCSADDRFIINNYIEPVGWSYQKEWLDAFFPINSVIITTNFSNPGFRIVGTRWVLESQGLFPVGVGTGTDKNNDSFTFTPGGKNRLALNLSNGDRAGEFRGSMDVEDLPVHSHNTDTHTEIVPEQRDGEGTNVGFIFYFGNTINPGQLVREDQRYLDADAIEAFEYNTAYGDISHYRDSVIRESHRNGKVYTDADFNPRFANQTLEGWGPPQAAGPGWGGILNTTGRFVGNSPRPVGVRWEFEGTEYSIAESFYDPRASDRVHPGRFPDRELIKARDFIIHILGITEAAKALAGVDRLKELDATVEQAYGGDNTYYGQIPKRRIVESSMTGQYTRHNNIPPNFPVYLWRRVPLDYVEDIPPTERPGTNSSLPMQFIITSNKKSTKNNVFNLNRWAVDNGWNGQALCKIIIDEGVYIYSDDPSDDKVPAMIIDQFPGGLELINKGFIMGRGGNGGSKYSINRSGQAGGDAIHVIGNSEIIIDNTQGAIGGGGGGGAPAYNGENSGGGGGAGGGWGGTSRQFIPGQSYYNGDGDGGLGPGGTPTTASGGGGGEPGQRGGHGHYLHPAISSDSLQTFKAAGDIVTIGWGPRLEILPGIGGQAGGSGAGGKKFSGRDSQGTGGGGGRILTATAYGGGTGGVPGAEFGALDIAGNLKARGDGPAWSGRSPQENGSVDVTCTGRGRNQRCTETYVTAYNSSNPYLGWLSGYQLRSHRGYGNGSHPRSNIGPHWRADGFQGTDGLPYALAHMGWPSTRYGYDGLSYLSPTGWDGYRHRSALVRGGSVDQPGIFRPPGEYRAPSKFGGGGGGWGASGAGTKQSGSYYGGIGGYSVRATVGSVTITGGLVYGKTEGNVDIG